MSAASPMTTDDRDGASYEQLYRSERHRLFRLALLLVGDTGQAEDVVQQAFANLWPRWGQLDEPGKAPAYLSAAVVNGCRSVGRRRGTATRYWHSLRGTVFDSTVLTSAVDDAHLTVAHAVRALPYKQREVIVLRFWMDLSERDVADALGVPIGTVKSTSSRGLAALRRTLGDDVDTRG